MRDVSLIFEVPTIIITDMLECAHPPGTATLEFTPIFVIAEPSSLSSSQFIFDTHPTLFLFALHTDTVTNMIPANNHFAAAALYKTSFGQWSLKKFRLNLIFRIVMRCVPHSL